jgi:4-alpha-glucanotransferase
VTAAGAGPTRRRTSGLLLHPTSLPSRHGVGDLGPAAHDFLDFLVRAGQTMWQVLPLGPTGYGDSPYQCLSAFAGNPRLISLERLVGGGLLAEDDLAGAPEFPQREADFAAALAFKAPLLRKAFERFRSGADAESRGAFDAFCREEASWLDDFALFMAVKAAHEERAWTEWPPDIRAREPAAMERWRSREAEAIGRTKFEQHVFFAQWEALRAAGHAQGLRFFGDVPIFVAHDSADVWAHPELFRLLEDGRPEVVAGVPPDYFSATGQLWGNPLYRWDVMAKGGYRWWISRLQAALRQVDLVRLDHFRGFEAYWEVPAAEETAVKGRWVKGPGAALFEALEKALGPLPIVAENLGVITPAVEALRARFGLPGMAILQFAFGSDAQANTFIPHNLDHDVAAYTGTHDNDTTVGWWSSAGAGDSTRSDDDVDSERAFALKYLDAEGKPIHWAFIRALMASVARIAVVPVQDVLGLGSEARMNLPGRANGNWGWRLAEGELRAEHADRLRELAEVFGRVPIARADEPAAGEDTSHE